jgi:superfamily II DNA/RNA helicase
MMTKELSLWIAQSESWQTFIDFDLPEDSISRYPFLKRPDDFYISLFGEMYELLEDVSNRKTDLLLIAKGLEIFSLKKKKDNFNGVNQPNNLLFASGLYYLSDYSASAYILANLFELSEYERDIDKFLLCFLKRKLDPTNPYCILFSQFLVTGDKKILDKLISLITDEKEKAFKSSPVEFSVLYLAESILAKFAENNIWFELLKQNSSDHWNSYVENSTKKSFPVWDFFPSQKIALEKGILNSFQSIALQTPTSSGKTAICELIIYNEHKNNPNCKILYLAPFRALAAELKNSFGRNLSKLGITSKTIYGGNIPTNAEKELIQNVTLLIATPEKFMALENSIANFLDDFTFVICDEGHLLEDGNRGLNYELLLSRLKNQKAIKRKFIFISAIIPNITKINEWLGGTAETVVRSVYRATEIEYGFLRKESKSEGVSFTLDVNPLKPIPQNYKLNRFLTEKDFTFQNTSKKGKVTEKIYPFVSVKTKSVAIALKALNSGSVALFTPTKGGVSGVSALAAEVVNQLTAGLPLPNPASFVSDQKHLINLKEYFEVIFGTEYTLCKVVEYGVLFHHGDLPQYVREIIEDSIRSEKVKFIICTNTLAEGVNLPIRTIVINSAQRYNVELKRTVPINLRDLKNLVGRAGRAGKETKGLIIIANDKDFPTIEDVISDKNIQDVNGYLYYIINLITKNITDRRLTLTNDILEAQDDEFQELIGSIDISIIDLLGEEVVADELQQTIQDLIDQTFAKFQCNEHESKALNDLIGLRGERLKPIIESNEFSYLKQSGLTIRTYFEIRDILDLESEIWELSDSPVSDEWLNFLFDDKISTLSIIKYRLAEFNKVNKVAVTFSEIKQVVKLWIEGSWFPEISKFFKGDIDIALRFVNSFLAFHIQSVASAIIRNAEIKLEEQGIDISTEILHWPHYLMYGLRTELQLTLVDIGFNDRIGIIELSKILDKRGYEYSNFRVLKSYLGTNQVQLQAELKTKIPQISFTKMSESFTYLNVENMN